MNASALQRPKRWFSGFFLHAAAETYLMSRTPGMMVLKS